MQDYSREDSVISCRDPICRLGQSPLPHTPYEACSIEQPHAPFWNVGDPGALGSRWYLPHTFVEFFSLRLGISSIFTMAYSTSACVGVTVTSLLFTWLTTCLRGYVRLYITRFPGPDDLFSLFALVRNARALSNKY